MNSILVHECVSGASAHSPPRMHARYRTADVGLSSVGTFRTVDLSVRKLGLVHDLRNMLQIAASALQLIDREIERATTTDVHRLTRSGLVSIERAAALSREILSTSPQIGAGSEDVDLVSALAEMRDMVSLTAGPAVSIDILSADGALPVRCDRREFEDALLNLVANARDSMPAGGRLTISLFQASDPTESTEPLATLRVEDSGCGMSEETVRRALLPFFTTKEPQKGTGLGLAMVNDFAIRAGGSVDIESVLELGTSITLRLPVATVMRRESGHP